MKKATRNWGGKRPGAGAPPKMQKGKYFTVRLPQEAIDEITQIADEQKTSIAGVIRDAVEHYLKRRRKKAR